MRSVAAAGAPSVEEKDSWQVAAIVDWRYSDNEHAAAALFGGDKRPDMFELLWEQTGSSSHRERTWQSVSDLTGGYASQMLQEFLQKEYFSPPVQAAAAGTSKRKGGAPKAPSSKRAKLPAVVAIALDQEQEALGLRAAAMQPDGASDKAVPPQQQQQQQPVLQLPSAAEKMLRSSSTCDATAARTKIKLIVEAALEDMSMSNSDVGFFNKLMDLLYPEQVSLPVENGEPAAVNRAPSTATQASPVIAATAPATDGIAPVAAAAKRTKSVAGQKHRTLSNRRVSRAVSTATQATQLLEATSQASCSIEFDQSAD
jgi:hypothetical protein